MNRIDAEAAVLGGLMLDAGAFWRVADIIGAEEFSTPEHRRLWNAMTGLVRAEVPCDAVTIGEREPELFELATYLAASTPGAASVRAYAEFVARGATERRVRAAGQRIATLSGDDVLGEAQRVLAACAPRQQGTVKRASDFARAAMRGVMERHAAPDELTGIPTGFAPLDELTAGWQRGDLVVIAARPSVGKTAFALQSALHAAEHRHPVLFVSLEMTGTQLMDRAIACLGHLDPLHLRQPKQMEDHEWPRATAALKVLDELPMSIFDGPATVEAIGGIARQVDATERLSMVVVDYLTYITPPKAETVAEATQEITRALKQLAKSLRVPVVLLSQLNRSVESRVDKTPGMADLRNSGAIEQDADVILFLHRPDDRDRSVIEATLAKQRNGPIGTFHLRARMERMHMEPCQWDRPRLAPSAGSESGLRKRIQGARSHAGGTVD